MGQKSRAVIITAAAPSADEQLASRRRKYILMMSCRIPCVVVAGLTAHIWWLALGLLALSIPLPWIAVLIANEAPVRRRDRFARHVPSAEPALLQAPRASSAPVNDPGTGSPTVGSPVHPGPDGRTGMPPACRARSSAISAE